VRHRPTALALLAALALALPARAATASLPAAGSHPALLPDLRTLQITGLSVSESGGHRQLNLSNEVGNGGVGALELVPRRQDCDGNGNFDDDRSAYQLAYRDANGDGVFEREIDGHPLHLLAGCMFFHPEHDHWHFEDFARYDLSTLQGDLVASTTKVSFCVTDSFRKFGTLPGSPESRYYSVCNQEATMGLSIGWTDLYFASLPGQSIVIDGVPDGTYCLSSTADPHDRLRETNESNNRYGMGVSLSGDTVTPTGHRC
jgi:Lysyl oxidase